MDVKMVHSQLELGDINASLDNLQVKPIQPSPSGIKECRICLSVDEKTDPFISPCQCTGSMKYVHHSCLKQWLQVKLIRDRQHPEQDNSGVTCQLCKQRIQVKMRLERTCNSINRIKSLIHAKKTLFFVSFLGFILCLSLICYSIVHLVRQARSNFNNIPIAETIIVIASLVLNIVLSTFFFYNLFGFLVSKKAEISLSKPGST